MVRFLIALTLCAMVLCLGFGCTPEQKETAMNVIQEGADAAAKVAPVTGPAAPILYAVGTIGTAIVALWKALQNRKNATEVKKAHRLLTSTIDAWKTTEPEARTGSLLSYISQAKSVADEAERALWGLEESVRKGMQ